MKPERRTFVLGLVALAAVAAGARAQAPAPEAAPAEVVEQLHAGLAEFAAEVDGTTLEQRIERLRPLIASTHALGYIAELTIRREWESLSDEGRARFVGAFERLSVATYASRFAGLDGNPFRTLAAGEPAGGRARVSAEIERENGEPVPLDYLLAERDGRWQIVNIVADGVSDLALKRAEYTRVLADGDIDDLVAELEEQVEAMKE